MRIALLHLSPRVGDLKYNLGLLETAFDSAAEMGAEWIVTPELCLPGYDFSEALGTDWIVRNQDWWLERFCRLAAGRRLTLFQSHPERDSETGKLYNSVFVIGPDGGVLGTHRKTTVIPGVEGWSNRGERVEPVLVPPLKVGVLICADAYTPAAARRLRDQGAQVLVSCAAWGPRPHGPERCWEERTLETGLPLFVCNRTGQDRRLDFNEAETVVVKNGERVISFTSPDSTVVFLDWDMENQTLKHHAFRAVFRTGKMGT